MFLRYGDAMIKIGDKVRLKTGGPVMAVEALGAGDSPTVSCVWFDRPDPVGTLWSGPHRQNFNAVVLEIVTEETK